ncbi:MAG TPA: VCBS repeat-containing protein, partial [Ignavibacteria bacterium]
MRNLLFAVFLFSFTLSYSQTKSWFTDITTHAGLDSIMNYFMYVSDINNDNYPDLLSEAGVQTENQLRLFINTANPLSNNIFDRIFVEKTESSGINPPGTIADFAVIGDVNNDGFPDVITTTYYYDRKPDCSLNPDNGARCEVLLNDGNGHFHIRSSNGLHELGPIPGSSLSLIDYDRDGNIDVFIGTHYSSWCDSLGYEFPNYLMKGNGDGSFTDVSEKAGIRKSIRALFGSNVGDWNNDGWQDMLTCPYEADGYGDLFMNNGNGTFTDVSKEAGYNPHFIRGDRGQGMVPWAAEPYDFDNDGDMDILFLLIHGGADLWEGRSTIFINQGRRNKFLLVPDLHRIIRKDPQSSHHGDNQGRYFDIDNDCLPDLAMTECVYKPLTDRLYIFRQDSSHTFIDITSELGFITDTSAESINPIIRIPHAIEPADFDLDGDDDLF